MAAMKHSAGSPDHQAFEQARQARDPRFDGQFFVGVKTTGIYCRPVCPVKVPRPENVLFFPSAAAAGEAGFRPCLRCRPEASPGTPAWAGTSTTVNRGLRLINEGALDEGSIESLSNRLGVTPRHLSRLFRQHLGASPKAVAQTRRLHAAKKLLDETTLPLTEIAMAAGYGSVRRFNDHLQSVYGRPPSALRGKPLERPGSSFRMKLPYRPPYDFDGVLRFLARRATPGVERAGEGRYERSIRIGDESGRLTVTHHPGERLLLCDITLPSAKHLMRAIERTRRLFDLNANPIEIHACLQNDPVLALAVARNPGLRVPGSWDPFEVLVRAIVGQQVSVAGATTVMGKIAREFGEIADGQLLFPAPGSLAGLKPGQLPMPQARARAIADAARAVCEGAIDLSEPDVDTLISQLTRIKGIGPWTAQYVAMRAINDPDAFLQGDLVLKKVAATHLSLEDEPALMARAEAWRPWRAYAAMYLWSMAA
jgi:AraC family transcriptional regulator of adaptative response / DNA-3-methyladenine glycosylase II